MSENGGVPVHVTIIMDGNGRWARQRGGERLMGHRNGVKSVREACEFAVEKGIKYLSLYAFSEENWDRPKAEVEGLMALMVKSVLEERETFRKNNIRFRVIGHRERLSADLLEKIDEAQEETSSNTGLTLIIMLSYSGRWDIVQAASRYAAAVGEAVGRGEEPPRLDEASFGGFLSTAGVPDPDLLIRTSGEQRISNYMLWQCAYTEFYFTDVLWPDFRKPDFAAALEAFAQRDRRYGKIK